MFNKTIESGVFLLVVLVVVSVRGFNEPFRVIREWKYLNFTWKDDFSYKSAVERGDYVPENNVMSGVDFYGGYYYITLPRMKRGVPASLVRIKAGFGGDPAPLLEPFPSWEKNTEGDCGAFQNVQNIEIDSKGLMWIVDGGRINTLGQPIVRCSPKLIIYDLKDGQEKHLYEFPEDVASKNGSFLYDLVIDDSDGGFAYITDNAGSGPGIVVYSRKQNRSWKITNSMTMRADPTAVNFKVGDITINAPINIAPIALGTRINKNQQNATIGDDREVFYSPLSSLHLYSINTTILKNEENSLKGVDQTNTIKDIGLKIGQTAGMIMDNGGTLYFGLLNDNSVARWNTHRPFSTQKVITRDAHYLQWPNSFTFDDKGNLTVLTNGLPKFIYSRLNLDEPNFRILSGHVGGRSYVYDNIYEYQTEESSPTSKMINFRNESTTESVTKSNYTQETSQIPQKSSSGLICSNFFNVLITTVFSSLILL